MLININELNLTQLYLNQRKVDEVSVWLNDDTVYDTKVTVIQYYNQYYIVDGHTRCYVAYLLGINEVPIEIYDIDINSLEMKLYMECMKWCKALNINHISDLSTRILPGDKFKELWLNKCKNEMDLLEDVEDSIQADQHYEEWLIHKQSIPHRKVMEMFNLN